MISGIFAVLSNCTRSLFNMRIKWVYLSTNQLGKWKLSFGIFDPSAQTGPNDGSQWKNARSRLYETWLMNSKQLTLFFLLSRRSRTEGYNFIVLHCIRSVRKQSHLTTPRSTWLAKWSMAKTATIIVMIININPHDLDNTQSQDAIVVSKRGKIAF